MKAGRFITVEGIEGVGKTTNLEFIENYLMQHGVDVVVRTREPGGTPLAEDIRALLLQERAEEVDAVTELLLMFAGTTCLERHQTGLGKGRVGAVRPVHRFQLCVPGGRQGDP